LNPNFYRERLVTALHEVLGGGPAVPHDTANFRRGLMLTERKLLIVAGDVAMPLMLDELLAMARKEEVAVLAGYIDPHKPGHRFQLDLMIRKECGFAVRPVYSLWLPDMGWPWLVPTQCSGLAVALARRRPVATRRRPYRDEIGRTLGLARGHAALWAAMRMTPQECWSDY
jgi:hypothetical protein